MTTQEDILNADPLANGEVNYTRANETLNKLAGITNATLAVDLSAADATLTTDQMLNYYGYICSGNSVARTLNVLARQRAFAVYNAGSEDLTVALGASMQIVPASQGAVFAVDNSVSPWQLRMVSSGGGGGGSATTVVEVAGTSHTVTGENEAAFIVFDSGNDCTVTVPQQTTEALREGFYFLAVNKGGGNLSVATEGSDVLVGISLAADPEEPITVLLEEIAGSPQANTWRMVGNLWLPYVVEDSGQLSPPVTSPEPSLATVVLVGTGSPAPSGDFAGQDNNFAIKTAGGWEFVEPADGQRVRVRGTYTSPNNSRFICYDAQLSSWVDE